MDDEEDEGDDNSFCAIYSIQFTIKTNNTLTRRIKRKYDIAEQQVSPR